MAAIFNPVRKILTSSLDAQIKDIKNKIDEVENLKNKAQKALDELKERETKVEKEIQNLNLESEKRIAELKDISTTKLTDQIEKRKILAENKIEQLVRDTNNSIKNYISSVAIEATKNILIQNLNKDKKSALIEESITEFNSVLKN
ncbi:hypothetical protein OA258_01110 [Pelagibacteraceae bacterium]|nr:hypothetical protein [Pelagibacteraceae bacterium]